MPLSDDTVRHIRDEALERFLSYVTVSTSSDEDSGTHPSSSTQFVLARQLETELRNLGVEDVELDQNCYLYARLPPSPGTRGPAVGLLAHLDTSPSVPGDNVRPLVREAYDGLSLSFPDDPGLTLDPEESPELLRFRGEDIVTASGATLLGADDKAGIAEIMTAVSAFARHPELPHPELCLCFTPDEEIGAGSAMIRADRLGKVAYTLDGGVIGELEAECFDARGATVRFHGTNVHPGYAKNRMVNAAAAAARFHAALPEWQMPEHTGDRDGFFHLTRIVGTESDAEIRLIVRDFAAGANDRRIGLLQAQRAWFMALHPGLGIDLEVTEQYRNMKEVLDRHPATVEVARKAMDAAGVAVIERAIRGGTDGARLCFMGIPTPNLFAGGLLPHSRKEWIPVSALQKATEVIIALACLWHDRP